MPILRFTFCLPNDAPSEGKFIQVNVVRRSLDRRLVTLCASATRRQIYSDFFLSPGVLSAVVDTQMVQKRRNAKLMEKQAV